jgi:hypothetical protein
LERGQQEAKELGAASEAKPVPRKIALGRDRIARPQCCGLERGQQEAMESGAASEAKPLGMAQLKT